MSGLPAVRMNLAAAAQSDTVELSQAHPLKPPSVAPRLRELPGHTPKGAK